MIPPVVIIADLMAAGLHLGFRVLRRPTMPETWGQDMDVPEYTIKGTRRSSTGRFANGIPSG